MFPCTFTRTHSGINVYFLIIIIVKYFFSKPILCFRKIIVVACDVVRMLEWTVMTVSDCVYKTVLEDQHLKLAGTIH